MSPNKPQTIESHSEYFEKKFNGLDLKSGSIEKTIFDDCSFTDCHFSKAKFEHCKFVGCRFKSSDLSVLNVNKSSFVDVEFQECKMTGINWTNANWPSFTLCCPLFFSSCDLSLSSFFELKLPEISMSNCKAVDCDFRGCDLSSADFSSTDFEKAQFMHTNLSKADFTDAINYYISPIDNSITKAKFSLPEAMDLLHIFEVEIH